MPQSVYEEPIVQHGRRTWITDPALVKTILLDDRESIPKTGIEARVFGGLLGQGILIAEDAAWRWQRQAAAPILRHADILQYVPIPKSSSTLAFSKVDRHASSCRRSLRGSYPQVKG